MSAYGAIAKPSASSALPLPSTTWRAKHPNESLTIHHLTLTSVAFIPQLTEYLHEVFTAVVVEGQTYPMELADGSSYTKESFEAYFFSADVFVAIKTATGGGEEHAAVEDRQEVAASANETRAGRSWKDCVAGFYYIKPNYPGRSSHICNGGFVVPKIQQNNGYGHVLANSFLHYAPKLGYRASVFNLVFVNNTASVRLWEKMNFKKAGLIPQAGRLRKKDGDGEEFVDAWVFYKNFVEDHV